MDALWLIVLYVGALAALIAFLRTLFVPPRGGVDEKDRRPVSDLAGVLERTRRA